MNDPMLAAASLLCGCGCGGESWPVRAAWVGDGLVLAEYEPAVYPCHQRGGGRVVLVDLGAGSEVVPAVIRPRRCRAVAATTGRQCRHPAGRGSAFCAQHDPDRQAAS
jgi:hypothetical protein